MGGAFCGCEDLHGTGVETRFGVGVLLQLCLEACLDARLEGDFELGLVLYPNTPPASSSLELSNVESKDEVNDDVNVNSSDELDEKDRPRLRRISLNRGGRSALRVGM